MTAPSIAAPVRRDTRHRWHLAIVACWLTATGIAFWWHAARAADDAGTPATIADFDPARLPYAVRRLASQAQAPAALADHAPFTLVHLRDPACRCNGVADLEVAELHRRFAARGVRVSELSVRAGASRAEAWLAATPAVALLDASGNLLYLGPVTDTGFCGTRSSRVVRALESALSGTPAPAQPTLATGCFCT